MKIMKRKISFGLILFLLIFSVSVVHAVTTDTKGPTVKTLNFFEKGALKPGQRVNLSTDLTDDVSGVDKAYLWVTRIKVNSDKYYGNVEDMNQALQVMYDENNTPYVVIPDNYIGGSYYIREIDLFDKEGNRSWYYTKDQMQFYHEMFVSERLKQCLIDNHITGFSFEERYQVK